jgi:ATP-dependent Clp protease ATP-binding subunit ClpC
MFSKFTQEAIQVVMYAQEKAKKIQIPFINSELIFYGILKVEKSVVINVLKNLNVDINLIRGIVQKKLQTYKSNYKNDTIPFSPQVKNLLSYAWDEARQLGHNNVAIEHLFLAVLKDSSSGVLATLAEANIDATKAKEELLSLLSENYVDEVVLSEKKHMNNTPTLDIYGLDLTKLARENKLDPVIGRESETKRIMQILSRRTKNNPVLTGEAGVGKTAIVEGLAQMIISENAPPTLLNKRVVTLDLGLLVAGTRFRGEFEERIKKIIEEIKNDHSTILFIDEIHTIIGTGNSEGSLDVANMMKPALARGEIQCIGATTINEYRKSIENDAALERRFQSLLIDPPSREDTLSILKGIRAKYEEFHKVKITDDALESAVDYSIRYITNRQLPDKAVDLIDEAASTEMMEACKNSGKACKNKAIVVDTNSIINVVSVWTSIPLKELSASEAERLKKMPEQLSSKVIGQAEAINSLAKAIKRSKAGLKNPKRPTGSFLFLGPSGVGKTELAKQLAVYLFGKEDAIVRTDMSEYTEKHTTSRLIGSPPGYVGYNEGGLLTEPVRQKPFSIVLFDEIEKAHPEVLNLLLQVMEDGRLTDSTGKVVDFKNTIVLMTSNVGAKTIENSTTFGFKTNNSEKADYEIMKEKIMADIKETFRPEFINRVDDVIVFKTLAKEDLESIAQLFIDDINNRIKDKEITIKVSPKARTWIIEKSFEANKGARPVRKAIQEYIEDPISDLLIDRDLTPGSSITVGLKKDILTYTKK